MKRITAQSLEQYLHDDWVMMALDRHSSGADESLTAQRWLRQSAAKRHVFSCLYADLLRSDSLRVVDVGGGLSAFTRVLAQRHDYCLIDIMAHEAPSALCGEAERLEIRAGDWYEQGF